MIQSGGSDPMRRHLAVIAFLLAASSLSVIAQADQTGTDNAAPAPTTEAETVAKPQASAAPASAPSPASAAAAPKLDALVLYRQGRDLETAGRMTDAQTKYVQSIAICDKEIASSPKRIEAYVVKCWGLFRLNRHAEVISTGQDAMKINFDARVSEVMGESYYFLGQMDNSLKCLQKYLEVAGDDGDRGPTALFFLGETYLRLKKYSHADIAYSTALAKEPSMPRWWLRLGAACEAEGEWQRSLDAYTKALALSPAYQEAKDGQARMKAQLATH
jgi:tetratricopeptide (TPR) repeat protein